jgi:Sec-independent protein translocase protein TatA
MNHTIKGILIVAAITSMLVVGATMVPIMQNSFAHTKSEVKKTHEFKKAHDFKKEARSTDTNTNTNNLTASLTSSNIASNTNNINNTNTQAQNQEQSACAVAVTCPEGNTTVALGLGDLLGRRM